jgi:hypothetical protein
VLQVVAFVSFVNHQAALSAMSALNVSYDVEHLMEEPISTILCCVTWNPFPLVSFQLHIC